MADVWQPLSIASFYLALAGLLGKRLKDRRGTIPASPGVRVALVVTLVLHVLVVVNQAFSGGQLRIGFENSVALTAAVVTAVYVVTSWFRPVAGLALIILPVAAVSLLLTALPLSHDTAVLPISAGLLTHILVSLCAYGVLAFAALQALVTAYQDRQLHRHRSTAVTQVLPPLQVMERLLFQLIGLGFGLLTLSLGTGWLFVDNDTSALGMLEKSLLSICAWVLFAVLLVGRMRLGWRGRTALRWTLAGFAALVAAYFGTKVTVMLLT